jgi:hypothetical protein
MPVTNDDFYLRQYTWAVGFSNIFIFALDHIFRVVNFLNSTRNTELTHVYCACMWTLLDQ